MSKWKTAAVLGVLLGLVLLLNLAGRWGNSQSRRYNEGEQEKNDRHMVFIVTGNGVRSHVAGVAHAASPDQYPLRGDLLAAFDESAVLVTERDLRQPVPQPVQSESFERHVSPETVERVRGLARVYGLEYGRLRGWDAMAVAGAFRYTVLEREGYSMEYGLDTYFTHRAAAGGKPIQEAEGLALSKEISNRINRECGEEALALIPEDPEKVLEEFRTMESLLREGNAEKAGRIVEAEASKGTRLAEIYWLERNRNMTERIEGYLEQGKSCFIVIGAGHVLGKGGILDLLEKKGWKVEQMEGAEEFFRDEAKVQAGSMRRRNQGIEYVDRERYHLFRKKG
ncbi:TraB/GumN family protein [Anaerotalea alkaliphila]|uniref:TraB/GumN family protein n=1 Tax=Anaerotalea alkaliphila TaxID=2662126 RepID=A0A7X5HVN1_9FIRM|nr:TraB/GumN family protein [Anaerotalea alkaliphila]NDL67479.1 TraB/GumN family protein [Anaerotalea alkaliphila]